MKSLLLIMTGAEGQKVTHEKLVKVSVAKRTYFVGRG
jgi:hypothetical protein